MSHVLPSDPKAEVIRWESTGGLGSDAAGPDLVVRADGTASVAARFAGGRPVHGRIEPQRLQDVLHRALDEHRFFAIDESAIAPQIEAALGRRGGRTTVPVGPPYLDAGTTAIEIAADGRRHGVRVQGLFAAARDFPEIDDLARLRAIERDLLELAQELARGLDG